jgi:hypothetical protein
LKTETHNSKTDALNWWGKWQQRKQADNQTQKECTWAVEEIGSGVTYAAMQPASTRWIWTEEPCVDLDETRAQLLLTTEEAAAPAQASKQQRSSSRGSDAHNAWWRVE